MEDAQVKKYTFKVAVDANKTEVKNAVEEIFDVEVAKVNIMNVVGKKKENGKIRRHDIRQQKAIVTLTEKSKKSNSSRVCNIGGRKRWQ